MDAKRLAIDVQERDGVDLRLGVGLNSGQVIAGEIGSGPFGYTSVGKQVGVRQDRLNQTGCGVEDVLAVTAEAIVDGGTGGSGV